MLTINLNYDRKYDILYARFADYSPSYGDEESGIVTYYSIETDEITGMAIYNVSQKILQCDVDAAMLPIPIDLYSLPIRTLLSNPENGYKLSLHLA